MNCFRSSVSCRSLTLCVAKGQMMRGAKEGINKPSHPVWCFFKIYLVQVTTTATTKDEDLWQRRLWQEQRFGTNRYTNHFVEQPLQVLGSFVRSLPATVPLSPLSPTQWDVPDKGTPSSCRRSWVSHSWRNSSWGSSSLMFACLDFQLLTGADQLPISWRGHSNSK